jgi:hypothetical protein
MSEQDLEGVAVAGANSTLWRYMSLSKLLQLLQSRTIWFTRVDQLIEADPYEGSLPFTVRQSERSPEKEAAVEKKHQMKKGSLSIMRDMFFESFQQQRKCTFVSCWHSGATDNDAMWRLYGAEKDGLCVRSTVSRLLRQLPEYVHVGRVEYVSYDDKWLDNPNVYVPFFRKRTCFQHESEVRFLFNSAVDEMGGRRPSPLDKGWAVQFQPQDCLTEIYVSPTAPTWFQEVVKKSIEELGLSIPVQDAPMARRPTF